MNILREAAVACVVFAALVMPARAFEIYRYLMPDGTVLYTHEVSTEGRLQEVIESPAPDTKSVLSLAVYYANRGRAFSPSALDKL